MLHTAARVKIPTAAWVATQKCHIPGAPPPNIQPFPPKAWSCLPLM